MTYSLTVFKSPRWWEEQQRFVYDNKTHRRMDFESWERFSNFLYKLSERPLEGKQNAELISPAVYEAGTTRSNKNVLAWAGWCAVDIDDWVFEGDLKDELYSRIGRWNYVVYSTASSTIDRPKFRIVFQLDRDVPAGEIRHFWFALQSHLDDRGDKQCKDFCRMYYIPAQYVNANNFIFSNTGDPVAVDFLLAAYPYSEKQSSASFLDRLPDAWREQIIEHRKSALDNTSYYWTSYQDCPFLNKRLISDWTGIAGIDGTGRYRMIYKIMISIAGNAVKRGYPLTANQLVELIKQLDADTSRKYQNRALDIEANNALEYAYKHSG